MALAAVCWHCAKAPRRLADRGVCLGHWALCRSRSVASLARIGCGRVEEWDRDPGEHQGVDQTKGRPHREYGRERLATRRSAPPSNLPVFAKERMRGAGPATATRPLPPHVAVRVCNGDRHALWTPSGEPRSIFGGDADAAVGCRSDPEKVPVLIHLLIVLLRVGQAVDEN